MANFLVSYDLNGSTPRHRDMDQRQSSLGAKRLLETVWWVPFGGDGHELHQYLWALCTSNDRLLTVQATNGFAENLLVAKPELDRAWSAAA